MKAPIPAPAAATAIGKPRIAPPSSPQAPPYQPPLLVEMSWVSRRWTSPSSSRTTRHASWRPNWPWAALVEAVTTASHAAFSSSNTATTSASAIAGISPPRGVTPRHPVRVTPGHPGPRERRASQSQGGVVFRVRGVGLPVSRCVLDDHHLLPLGGLDLGPDHDPQRRLPPPRHRRWLEGVVVSLRHLPAVPRGVHLPDRERAWHGGAKRQAGADG